MKIVRRILIVILVLGLLASMIFMGKEIIEKMKLNNEPKPQPSTSYTVEEVSSSEPDNRPKAPVRSDLDWNAISKQNPHIYAWISIPGTNIEYPVLQHPSDDNFYLLHNLDGSAGYPGCIYSQSLNSKDFTDPNTVLYGHCMKNGTMFKELRHYEDLGFLNANKYVYIYTPNKVYSYEIFNACVFNDRHVLYQYNFNDKGGFKNFLTDLQAVRGMASHYRNDVPVSTDDRIITLSTCVTADGPTRWLVVGVLVNEEELH